MRHYFIVMQIRGLYKDSPETTFMANNLQKIMNYGHIEQKSRQIEQLHKSWVSEHDPKLLLSFEVARLSTVVMW